MDELIAFLNARLAEDEQGARDAAFAVADHTYAPVDAQEMSAKTVNWTTTRVLMHRRVTVEDPGWDPKVTDIVWASVGDHIARHDPARVLADVAAKRAIVELHQPRSADLRPRVVCMTCATSTSWGDADEYPCATIKLLALPYADHPDYDALRWELSV